MTAPHVRQRNTSIRPRMVKNASAQAAAAPDEEAPAASTPPAADAAAPPTTRTPREEDISPAQIVKMSAGRVA